MSRPTRLTALADPCHPLNAHTLSHLDRRMLRPRSHLHNLAHALVPADLPSLRGEWQHDPRVHHDAQVGVADARMRAMSRVREWSTKGRTKGSFDVQVNQDLSWAWLWHIELLDLSRDGPGLIVHDRLVLLG